MRTIAAVLVLFAFGCGSRETKVPDFEGHWTIVQSNDVSDATDTKKVRVWSSGDRFRLLSEETSVAFGQDPATHTEEAVFDGKTLHLKITPPAEPDGTVPAPLLRSEPADARVAANRRFWIKSFPGAEGPGGQVAGRPTLLKSLKSAERHQEFNSQVWMDKETGIVLKHQLTLYSTQVNAVIHRETIECNDLRFGPVPEDTFSPPR